MGVRRRDDLGMGRMDRRVDDEPRLVDRLVADQDVAVVIDELQVGHPDVAEILR
jgi:hypothetical protein